VKLGEVIVVTGLWSLTLLIHMSIGCFQVEHCKVML